MLFLLDYTHANNQISQESRPRIGPEARVQRTQQTGDERSDKESRKDSQFRQKRCGQVALRSVRGHRQGGKKGSDKEKYRRSEEISSDSSSEIELKTAGGKPFFLCKERFFHLLTF